MDSPSGDTVAPPSSLLVTTGPCPLTYSTQNTPILGPFIPSIEFYTAHHHRI